MPEKVSQKMRKNIELRKAVMNGKVEELKQLIRNGADPNYVSRSIPTGTRTQTLVDFTNAMDLACKSKKKPNECLKAIIARVSKTIEILKNHRIF